MPKHPTDRPIDPDVDLHDEKQRDELHHHHPLVLGAIAVGGIVGAEARYGLARAMTHPVGGWPWSTLVINVLGGLLIGVLMASLARLRRPPQLARPFLGTGILGGFTTFSTYALDLRTMAAAGHPVLALGYAAATVAACLLAVGCGIALTRSALRASTVPA